MTGNPISANDTVDYKLESPSASNYRMARTLRALIFFGQIILAVSAVILFAASIFIMFSSDLQAQLYESVGIGEESNAMMLPLVCLGGAVIAAAWFWVLYMLQRIVGTLITGDPFVPENINRLRRMWIVIAAMELVRMAIVAFASQSISSGDDGLQIRLGVWFLVFVIATLSEAFRYGAAMRQEQELTI